MKILAIRFARLGDIILLLPALSSLKSSFPQAKLSLLTGHRCAPIAELWPDIDDVISVDRVAMRDGSSLRALGDMAMLVREIRQKQFDLVIDFHSFRETNLLTWLSAAPVRIGMKRYREPYLRFCFNREPVIEDKSLHVAEMFRRVVQEVVAGLPSPAALSTRLPSAEGKEPALVVPADVRDWVQKVLPGGLKLILYVAAPVKERMWPATSFAELADHAVQNLGARVVVVAGREGPEPAHHVLKASRNAGSLTLLANLSIPQLASVIASGHVLVSNDTGPMHIGAVSGVPTLGLFSVGYPEHFRPVGPKDRFLRANPIEEIQVVNVIRVVEEMWRA